MCLFIVDIDKKIVIIISIEKTYFIFKKVSPIFYKKTPINIE